MNLTSKLKNRTRKTLKWQYQKAVITCKICNFIEFEERRNDEERKLIGNLTYYSTQIKTENTPKTHPQV